MKKLKGKSPKTTKNDTTRASGYGNTRIKRHKIDYWESYEVKKEELESLENGSRSDKFLEFGIATASAFISFLIAFFSVDPTKQERLYYSYLLVIIALGLASALLIFLWLCERGNNKSIFDQIRKRPLEEEGPNS